MKRIIASIFFVIVIAGSVSASAGSGNIGKAVLSKTGSKGLTNDEVTILSDRLREIHKLSKTNLTASRRQELREEVFTIKEKITDPVGGGIYISAGALILIIILLIIIL